MVEVILSEIEYEAILQEIEDLMDIDPEPDSEEGKKLHLLALLVKNYEKDIEIKQLPEPIEAIKFKMEQENKRK